MTAQSEIRDQVRGKVLRFPAARRAIAPDSPPTPAQTPASAATPVPAAARIHALQQAPTRPIIIPAIASDGTLYPMEKLAAHRAGTLHLAVSVFVFSGDALLIQRRAATKYHCAGLWANTCCTHPYWDETLSSSASRRLTEELGVNVPLYPRRVIDYVADVGGGLTECERVQVFRGDARAAALRLAPNPDEVDAVRWATVPALRVEVAENPTAFAPWFRIYLERWDELGL
jgi:isopentenyl-diphosphate Delta-isomerase